MEELYLCCLVFCVSSTIRPETTLYLSFRFAPAKSKNREWSPPAKFLETS